MCFFPQCTLLFASRCPPFLSSPLSLSIPPTSTLIHVSNIICTLLCFAQRIIYIASQIRDAGFLLSLLSKLGSNYSYFSASSEHDLKISKDFLIFQFLPIDLSCSLPSYLFLNVFQLNLKLYVIVLLCSLEHFLLRRFPCRDIILPLFSFFLG